jgi:malate dehydrogenase (oxaloacetate-decarboxylating)(NADP+)
MSGNSDRRASVPTVTPTPVDAQAPQPKTVVPSSEVQLHGLDVCRHPHFNKGMAFTVAERKTLRLHGLLPPVVLTQDQQAKRVIAAIRGKETDLERFIYLAALCDRNEKLYYHVLSENVEELMPIVYTPTVGLACQRFGHIYRRPRGLYITIHDKGQVASILQNWPLRHKVRCIVFTDGERILGLGDLGTYGMGIPIGKLALYSACAGVPHEWCLPVCIDTGTNNESLLSDEFYTGVREQRTRDEAYDELIDEFIQAAKHTFGNYTLLQFEDFANRNAFRLLAKYRDQCCTFNDDIQGTASVVVAGIYGSLPLLKGKELKDLKILFYGAGSAGIGIADLIALAVANDHGIDVAEARKHIFLVDSKGLITKDRSVGGLNESKMPYAHEHEEVLLSQGLEAIVKSVKPDALIGVAAQAGVFTEAVIKAMGELNERPVIFALSNPTSKAECTAEAAYLATDGKAIFASGSPFKPVTITVDGAEKTLVPGQGNNSYIFPGVALGVLATSSRRVTDSMFLVAAKTLANLVTPEQRETGLVYPYMKDIRAVSTTIAIAVAEEVYKLDLAQLQPKPVDMKAFIENMQYETTYDSFAADDFVYQPQASKM